MKFFINNNNTTYNYSYYATRPKWLVEALLKKSLKEFRSNSLCFRKSFPIHKITFAPINKEELSTQTKELRASQLKSDCWTTNGSKTIIFEPNHKKKVYRHLFQTKELLCWTSDLSFFNLRGYFLNILKVLQICRFAVRNNRKILFIKGNHSNNGQGKLLNPWLLQYGRNTVPVTLRNLFNKSYLNPTHPLRSPQILCLKKNKGCFPLLSPSQKPSQKGFLKMANFVKQLNRLKEKNTPVQKGIDRQSNQASPYNRRYYQLSALLNSCLNFNFGKNCGYKTSHFKNQKTWRSTAVQLLKETLQKKTSNFTSEQKKTCLFRDPYLEDLSNVSSKEYFCQSLKKNNTYEMPAKKVAIRNGNIIKLWIKEAQTISQQTAAGLTIPLAGFLTNSKTTFNTIYNLSNYDFYNSINFKSSIMYARGVCQIKMNRLEKTRFEKFISGDLFSQPSEVVKAKVIKKKQTFKFAQGRNKDGLTPGLLQGSTVKSLQYINQKRAYRSSPLTDHLGTLAFSFPKVFENLSGVTTTFLESNYPKVFKGKRKKKQFTAPFHKSSNVNIVLKNPVTLLQKKRFQNFGQKGWWIDYSSIYNYLPLTPRELTEQNIFFKDSESVTHLEKTKKSKPLEYCFFGDILTWQSKSQKSSSMFYLNTLKNKDNIITYLKKQIILEKREPLV
jgi:hypothetical protein